jgi:putative ABC transport system permease protein
LRIGSLRREMVGDVSTRLWIFLGVVAFVLLIACANVASLLLVRATGRGVEFAVRASLGAGRRRIVQQLVTESVVIAFAGGALGLLLAVWATTAFVALAPSTIPRLGEVTIDPRVVVFAFLLAAATAVIFGAAPARYAARATLSDALKGVRLTRGAETRVRSALVVVEVALGLMLLVSAALLTRAFARLTQWDPGFDRAGLVTTWVLPSKNASDPVGVMQRVRDEVATIPGIRSAALGSGGPLFGGIETGGLSIEGRAPFAPADMPTIAWFDIGPHYFATLGVRFQRGRQFTPADDRAAPDVAIVNATFVRRFFQGEDPIGRRVTVNEHAAEIVGVVGDVVPFEPNQPTMPQIYWPIEQYRRGAAHLLIRIAPGSASVERAVQARASAVSAGMQVAPFVSLDERVARRLVSPRFNMLLVGVFALVALVLAMIGVYGVVAHTVASRTREIGVRVALGATPRQVSATVVRRGMLLAVVGIAGGCAGALATGRLLASLLSGLRASDPVALGVAVFLFLVVSLLACWLPARRASRLDPTVALRVE